MRTLVTSALLVVAALTVPAASADPLLGETQRYVGPTNGLDPCKALDADGIAYGGACFEMAAPGMLVDIGAKDDLGADVYAYYRVLDKDGNVLSSGHFCTQTTTRPLHANAARISVSVYVDHPIHCGASAGAGLSGAITARARPATLAL